MRVSVTERDFYDLLNIHPSTDEAGVRTAYRQAARFAHPDKGGSKEKFQLVAVAFEVLSCPLARAHYDHQRCQRQQDFHAVASTAPPSGPPKRRRAAMETRFGPPPAKRRRSVDLSRRIQASSAMERLRNALQCLEPLKRREVIGSLAPRSRSAFLTFMQGVSGQPPISPRRVGRRGCSEKPIAGTVRTKHYAHCTRYFAQVQFGALSLYTGAQTQLEAAIDHRIVLSRLCHAMAAAHAADPDFWDSHLPAQRSCEAVFNECQTTPGDLGLRVWVRMTATEWLPKSCVISSRVISLPCALELHANLRRARLSSWKVFRSEWIRLQLQKGIQQERAEAIADRAKEKGSQLHLAKVVHDVELEAANHLGSAKVKGSDGTKRSRSSGNHRGKPSSVFSRMMGA